MAEGNFLRLPYEANNPRQVAQVVNNVLDGKLNSTGEFTCTASAASTDVTDYRAGKNSVILLMPTTANASAEVGAGTIYITKMLQGCGHIAGRTGQAGDICVKQVEIGF